MPAGLLDVTLIVALYLGIMKASQPCRLKKTEKCKHSSTVSRAHSTVLSYRLSAWYKKQLWGKGEEGREGGGTSIKSSRIAQEHSSKLCPSFP